MKVKGPGDFRNFDKAGEKMLRFHSDGKRKALTKRRLAAVLVHEDIDRAFEVVLHKSVPVDKTKNEKIDELLKGVKDAGDWLEDRLEAWIADRNAALAAEQNRVLASQQLVPSIRRHLPPAAARPRATPTARRTVARYRPYQLRPRSNQIMATRTGRQRNDVQPDGTLMLRRGDPDEAMAVLGDIVAGGTIRLPPNFALAATLIAFPDGTIQVDVAMSKVELGGSAVAGFRNGSPHAAGSAPRR